MKYKLSPSKAHRFLHCTKSLEYDGKFVETPASIRGRILHTYGEMKLKKEDTSAFAEKHNINDYEEFLINAYANFVWSEYSFTGAQKLYIERKMSMSLFWFDINYIIDALLLSKHNASVIDLKSGNGDVDADDNEQLLMYGYGVLSRFQKIKKLRLSIFQKAKPKIEVITRDYVMDFFVSKYDVFEAIHNNELSYNPSEKACKFCNHKDKCVARAKWIVGGKNGETKV